MRAQRGCSAVGQSCAVSNPISRSPGRVDWAYEALAGEHLGAGCVNDCKGLRSSPRSPGGEVFVGDRAERCRFRDEQHRCRLQEMGPRRQTCNGMTGRQLAQETVFTKLSPSECTNSQLSPHGARSRLVAGFRWSQQCAKTDHRGGDIRVAGSAKRVIPVQRPLLHASCSPLSGCGRSEGG